MAQDFGSEPHVETTEGVLHDDLTDLIRRLNEAFTLPEPSEGELMPALAQFHLEFVIPSFYSHIESNSVLVAPKLK